MAEYQQLRKNEEAYRVFCELFLSCVVGRRKWTRQYLSRKVGEIATFQDEAFVLLLLENNWTKWYAEIHAE